MARETEEEKAQKRVNELYEKHIEAGYLWLNRDVVLEYQRKAKALGSTVNFIGVVRALTEELQTIYGLTEIEAFNIINGYNVNDYITKYYRIENRIPTLRIRSSSYDEEDENQDDWS